ncbi:hypothetical protein JX265_012733 [Neoarthrinium moseri]|uniref:Uncharacterized protein n=1 Tax=Neoarthrinium moseri TaxID=1658444 RepID=A0A9P9W9X3_9PEZI|nr:hypothetical protein JX265_012733 [Neoarthrinium moseri]
MYGFGYITFLALAAGTAATSVSTTPHDSYSSSVGVLGCKIDTNRVAYWPGSVDCNNICIKLTYGDRSVNLLRIDQSGGAHDISYDAWAYLQTGKSAAVDAITGGGVAMEYEEVDASECADLILTEGNKLPLSASNSMNYLASCLAEPESWVAQNHVLYNICDAICTLGYDETCTLDLATSNQPSCGHTLGLTTSLTSAPVHNIEYQSGKVVVAGSGAVASSYTYAEAGADSGAKAAPSAAKATSSSSVAASTPTTSAIDAVFLQVTSGSTSVTEYETAPASTVAASTTSLAAAPSTVIASSSAQTTESLASGTATTLVSPVHSYTATGSGSLATSAAQTSANASSTFLVATLSTARSSASSSSSAAATGTAQPAASGDSKLGFPASALLSSIAMYLLVSAL